jgi:hypothetical protein
LQCEPGKQLRFAPHFQAKIIRSPCLQDLFDHFPELVHFNGKNTAIFRLVIEFRDRIPKDLIDRFDPVSAEAAGVDLTRLLWVRESGHADRALKAMNLVLQAGGFGLVAFDLSDVRGPALRQFPHTTWMRIARIVEGSLTVAMLIGAEHIARSPGGATIVLERGSARAAVEWAGSNPRNRRLQGLTIKPRVISVRTIGAAAGTPRVRTSAG